MRVLLVMLFACACVPPKVVAPTVAPEHRVESDPIGPDPETEKLEGNLPPEDWVEPIEKGGCIAANGGFATAMRPCPAKSGIAMSEAHAARTALYKIRYKELRVDYVSDRKVWGAQRELYEKRLQLADQAIQDLQPSWWDRHKAEFGVIGGFVIGAMVTVAIVAISN